jgi:hypothetical protein
MGRKLVALLVALTLPGIASAGPLKDAAIAAGRELAQSTEAPASRARGWTAWGLIAGGGILALLGGLEVFDDDDGEDDEEDLGDADDGEDADGWENGALLGGGIAAAAVGGWLLLAGDKSGPVVSVRPGRMSVRQTIRF